MKTKVKDSVGYQVPSMLADEATVCQFLKDCGIKNPRLSIGKLYQFLSYLRVETHLQKHRYKDKEGWVPVSTDVIRQLSGNLKFFYSIKNKLLQDGMIECNRSYMAGKHSMGFRLTRMMQTDDWQVVKINANKCLTTRKLIAQSKSYWKPIDFKLYNRLTQFYIDEIDFFENTTCKTFKHHPCEILDAIIKKSKSIEQAEDRYSFYKDCYVAIRAGEWRYKPDDFGRRHNNLTNLPKILRKHLYVIKGGQKRRLKSVDISNSQVLLLLTILPSHLEDYELFKEIVEDGSFYECLAHMCGKKYDDSIRKELKEQYFLFVYGDNNRTYVWTSMVYQAMCDYFEDITSYINALKGGRGYQYPAQQMQKAESSIIIDHVCYQAIKKGLLFAQIYDSILCLDEDVETIKAIMKEGFALNNLKVDLKVEE
jgi:hypothetical protein